MTDVNYREYVRPTILIISIVPVGAIYGASALGTTLGGALVLTVIWFAIKGYRPSWTDGWSGAWLYITGLLTIVTAGVLGFNGPVNPWAVGLGTATIVVMPAMVVWKVFRIVSNYPYGDDGASNANVVEDGQ